MATTKQTKTADKVSTSLTSDSDISAIQAKKEKAEYNYQNAEYKPSDETQAYKKALEGMGDYQSQYKPQIDSTLANLQKGYDMSNDPTFKQYQDIYTRNAQEASRDVVARQAALNGGAASSMSQRQAGQAYNNTMQGLYDLVPQLSQQWTSNQQALLSAYQNQDQLDYTKYTDNRTFYQNMYLAAQDRDMDLYNTELQKMYNTIAMYQTDIETAMSWKEFAAEYNRQVEQDGISNAIAWAQQELQEAQLKEQQRQYDTTFAEDQRQFNANLAESQRVANMNDANTKAQLAENKRQYDSDRQVTLAELALKAANNGSNNSGGSTSSGSSTGSGSSNSSSSSATASQMKQYQTTLEKYWAKAENNSQSQNGTISAMSKYLADLYEDGKLSEAQLRTLDSYAQKLQNS